MKEVSEIFETLKELSKSYSLVKGYLRIEKGDEGFYFADITNDSFFQLCGLFPEEMIKEALENLETVNVEKEGCYEIDALLWFDQVDRREEIDSYLMVERIEYKCMCTLEEADKEAEEMKILSNQFPELFG